MSGTESVRSEAFQLLKQYRATALSFTKPIEPKTVSLKPDDIVISTFPKAGTTLLQNMAYQIAVATGGAASSDHDGTKFTDISIACPWIDYMQQFGCEEGKTSPRIFKTHSTADRCNLEQAKYIYVVRNPKDYPASWLNFQGNSHGLEKAKSDEVRYYLLQAVVQYEVLGIPLDANKEQLHEFQEGKKELEYGGWYSNIHEWIHEPRPNLMVLFYEDITKDMRSTIIKVARFMGRTISDEAVDLVMKRCDRETMSNDSRFKCGIEGKHFGLNDCWKVLPKDVRGFKDYPIESVYIDLMNEGFKTVFNVSNYDELRKKYGAK